MPTHRTVSLEELGVAVQRLLDERAAVDPGPRRDQLSRRLDKMMATQATFRAEDLELLLPKKGQPDIPPIKV